MALSETDKMLRRKLVGAAVRRLREHLSIGQTELGRMIDGGADRRSVTDPGSVSRWERGEVLPHEWKRNELVRIAREHSRNDLADAISDPVRNWRAGLLTQNRYMFNLITLLEICALNQEALGDSFYAPALSEMAAVVRDQLMKVFTPQKPPVLLDDYQRDFWNTMTEEIEQGRKLAEARIKEHGDGETSR
jgi:hypothetical protein